MELCKSLGSVNSLVMMISILASDASSDISLKDKVLFITYSEYE